MEMHVQRATSASTAAPLNVVIFVISLSSGSGRLCLDAKQRKFPEEIFHSQTNLRAPAWLSTVLFLGLARLCIWLSKTRFARWERDVSRTARLVTLIKASALTARGYEAKAMASLRRQSEVKQVDEGARMRA